MIQINVQKKKQKHLMLVNNEYALACNECQAHYFSTDFKGLSIFYVCDLRPFYFN